ncbi:hypothetical protein [Rhodococcus kronopolitis]|uniref:Uncharacterized protein n=1 Tax=Rhodococcus kronopolitis TaxID=1460226 RepID=A0ABV9FRG8_9NOCA
MTWDPDTTGHLPVVDVDTPFPPMAAGGAAASSAPAVAGDTAPAVHDVIRTILGWRPRVEDPGAFLDALTSSFRLTTVDGHTESAYVPHGFAVQADLGSVTGGQASLYRRAAIARTETLRILDALTPLRVDADHEDMEAFRGLVRGALENTVDELGNPGGPRIPIVDSYLRSLTGLPTDPKTPVAYPTPDAITGLLGQLRDHFGLIDANVNTIEEEEIRTAFWTLADLTTDLHKAWRTNQSHFAQSDSSGFLGTDLIRISRLMDAAADQTAEVEAVLDSALVPLSERQTITLNEDDNLTLDGLLSWIRTFLVEEGRHIAQDGGRNGIVAGLTPTINDIVTSLETNLAGHILGTIDIGNVIKLLNGQTPAANQTEPVYITNPGLPIGKRKYPAGMYSARTKIAVDGLRRLLRDLAITAQRISRFPDPVLFDITFTPLPPTINKVQPHLVRSELRGLNIRPIQIPAFRVDDGRNGCKGLVRPVRSTPSANADSTSAIFLREDLRNNIFEAKDAETINDLLDSGQPFTLPASAISTLVILDGAKGEPDNHQIDEYIIGHTPTKLPDVALLRPSEGRDNAAAMPNAQLPTDDRRKLFSAFVHVNEEIARLDERSIQVTAVGREIPNKTNARWAKGAVDTCDWLISEINAERVKKEAERAEIQQRLNTEVGGDW